MNAELFNNFEIIYNNNKKMSDITTKHLTKHEELTFV